MLSNVYLDYGETIISKSIANDLKLKKGDKVVLTGFGTFEVKTRAARIGKHPKTGEDIKIHASKSVHFKEGKALKDSL